MAGVPNSGDATSRRRRRIERQLRALRTMQDHMSTREIVWAVLTVPGVALLCVILAAKLHWLSKSVPLSLIGAVAAGVVVWWIGRRWFTIAALIVIALVCIIFEDVPTDLGGAGSDKKTTMDRRQKLERAIARREALLRAMDMAKP